jgi:YfiH family protein
VSTRFTERTGGISSGAFSSLNLGLHVGDVPSDVLANREILAKKYGPIQYMNQVHGNRVAIIEQVTDEAPTADALVTGIPGITLAVMVADCIPLLLTSKEAVAAVHVGRKGLVNGVALNAVSVMRDMGASSITAILGPSICGRCYEVGEDVYQEVVDLHPGAQSQTHQGTPALDLPRALQSVLEKEGISIVDKSLCTVESDNHFSYRRDGITGRQTGLISL